MCSLVIEQRPEPSTVSLQQSAAMMPLLWLAPPLAFIALVIGLSAGGKSITVGLNAAPALKIATFPKSVHECVRIRVVGAPVQSRPDEYAVFLN